MKTEIPEPEWTAVNMNRKSNSTTFKQCGWCKHASGSHRYGCCLSGRCALMKEYDNDVKWRDECKLLKLGKEDFKSILKSKEYEIKGCKQKIENVHVEIKEVNKLFEKAKNIPPLPDHRNMEFKIGSKVWVFIAAEGEKVPLTKWYCGSVVSGYRSGDGCVSYVMDELPASKQGWGCGVSVPIILQDWEYQYFKRNKRNFETWIELSNKTDNGNPIDGKAMFESIGE